MIVIADELVPFLTRNANGKIIRIKDWPADHGEDLAVPGIHRHHSAILAFKRLLGSHLYIEVNGEFERLAGNCGVGSKPTNLLTVTIHKDFPRAILPAQHVVVKFLDS